jgi:hypothetical protein
VGRAVVGIGAVAAIALETSLPIGTVAAFAVGIGSAAIVHLLFGSPAGRLTLDQVADALAELGVEATGLWQAPLEPRGVAIATAQDRQGRSLQVKIYGRDAWDGSCSPPPGPRCGTGATRPTSFGAAASRSSTRRS